MHRINAHPPMMSTTGISTVDTRERHVTLSLCGTCRLGYRIGGALRVHVLQRKTLKLLCATRESQKGLIILT